VRRLLEPRRKLHDHRTERHDRTRSDGRDSRCRARAARGRDRSNVEVMARETDKPKGPPTPSSPGSTRTERTLGLTPARHVRVGRPPPPTSARGRSMGASPGYTSVLIDRFGQPNRVLRRPTGTEVRRSKEKGYGPSFLLCPAGVGLKPWMISQAERGGFRRSPERGRKMAVSWHRGRPLRLRPIPPPPHRT